MNLQHLAGIDPCILSTDSLTEVRFPRLQYSNSEDRVEKACSEFSCKPQFTFTALMSGMQSSAMSTGMETIWDLNINRSRVTSPSVLSTPRRHWQIHKGINEIAVSSQFPPASPQRQLKGTLTFLWLPAVFVEREAIRGKKGNFKDSIWCKKPAQCCWCRDHLRSSMLPAHTDHLSRRVCLLYFHMVISSAGLLFYRLLPLVIWDYGSMLPLASALSRPPRVSNLSDKLWTNGFSWAGIWQKL